MTGGAGGMTGGAGGMIRFMAARKTATRRGRATGAAIDRQVEQYLGAGPTSVTWFRFTAPGMVPVVGAVQGSGGVIRYGVDESTRKMRRQTSLARSGNRLDVYEPRRGYVRVFPDYGPGGSGRHVDVDLRRASFEVVAVPGDPVPSAGVVG